MCHLIPILNGKSNLCNVKAELNQTKKNQPSAPDVKVYMEEMINKMQEVFVKVGNISYTCIFQKSEITKFVELLKQRLRTLYGLNL